jgi:SAM-dependent methyltransferase
MTFKVRRLLGRARAKLRKVLVKPQTPPPPEGFVDVRDLMKRLSVEELNRTADEYFKQTPTFEPFLGRPFDSVTEMPHVLIGFAHVLQGLEACGGMTVLDFGAGACWSSRFLTQLGYKVIAADVSPTALAIGREGFRRYPPVGRTYEPRFLVFDGHRLDLPDESVDRIVCLHAFHHVPNQEQVIREFARVLKPAGIAGFHEPGPEHSKSPLSQQEMRHFTVIENDIHMDAIWRMAQAAGFGDLRLAVWNGNATLVSLKEYDGFLRSGARHTGYEDSTRDFARGCRLFFLHKRGERPMPDSRQPFGLKAELAVALTSRAVVVGTPIRASVRVKNVGTTLWLPSDAEAGPVRLGAWLEGGGQRHLELPRHHLPRRDGRGVRPGEEVAFDIELPAITEPGRYRFEFDMVSEFVCWFGANGSPTVTGEVEVC